MFPNKRKSFEFTTRIIHARLHRPPSFRKNNILRMHLLQSHLHTLSSISRHAWACLSGQEFAYSPRNPSGSNTTDRNIQLYMITEYRVDHPAFLSSQSLSRILQLQKYTRCLIFSGFPVGPAQYYNLRWRFLASSLFFLLRLTLLKIDRPSRFWKKKDFKVKLYMLRERDLQNPIFGLSLNLELLSEFTEMRLKVAMKLLKVFFIIEAQGW